MNILTYQDLTKTDEYFSYDENMYLDLRRSNVYTNELESLTRDDSKLTLTVTLKDAAGYSQGKCYSALLQRGSIMQYKNYGTTKENNIAA